MPTGQQCRCLYESHPDGSGVAAACESGRLEYLSVIVGTIRSINMPEKNVKLSTHREFLWYVIVLACVRWWNGFYSVLVVHRRTDLCHPMSVTVFFERGLIASLIKECTNT